MENREVYRERLFALADALDSGQYSQCKGGLHKGGDGYCCLGVASDQYAKSPKNIRDYPLEWATEIGVNGLLAFGGDVYLPPLTVRDYYGLRNKQGTWRGQPVVVDDPEFAEGNGQRCLTCLSELNDNGWTFPQIAAFIRENWDRLVRLNDADTNE